jgi:uncharacterized damage-inducible protein DinB
MMPFIEITAMNAGQTPTGHTQDTGGEMISLADLMAYDRWANRRYLDVIAQLDSERFTRKLGGSFDSIRDTVVHLAWAEWVWAERWQGRSPKIRAHPDHFPTPLSVRSYLTETETNQGRFVEQLQPGRETTEIRYTNLKGEVYEYTLEQMVHHLTNHSTYHRGQLATLLRQLGVAPPTTDYLDYLDSRNATTTVSGHS